jgi:hypothetical protein
LRDFVSALASDAGIQHTLPAITAAATALIPGVDVADVLLAPGHDLGPAATASTDTPIASLHITTRQGPQWHAIRRRSTVRSGDLLSDPRWPAFATHAADRARTVLTPPTHLHLR